MVMVECTNISCKQQTFITRYFNIKCYYDTCIFKFISTFIVKALMQAVKHVTKKYIFTVEPFLYGLISEQNDTIWHGDFNM